MSSLVRRLRSLSSTARVQNAAPRARTPRWVDAATIALVLGFAVVSALLYRGSLDAPTSVPGLRLNGVVVDGADSSALDAAIKRRADAVLGEPITLSIGKHRMTAPRRDLGARVDTAQTRARLIAVGKSGNLVRDVIDRVRARSGALDLPLDITLHRETARRFFTRLAVTINRPPIRARLDLDAGTVVAGSPGYQLRVYDCIAAAESAMRRGHAAVELSVRTTTPKGDSRYAGLDISQVLGKFRTVYSLADKDRDRAHNLNVGASALDGHILGPGEQLSYNDVVGPRNKSQGYRTATIISQGELVDGMAGGSCQVSSTLYAASFFAGLELVKSRPHSIPSSYIKMGLDAAVAYPTTDLVIKNPYPFPVVLHYRVSRGFVTVTIRGKKRPWTRIALERDLKEVKPFEVVEREDPELPKGVRIVKQRGVPGFIFERRRLFFESGKEPKKVETRKLRYPATTQYVRVGTGPADPEFKPPKERGPFGDVPPTFTVSQ